MNLWERKIYSQNGEDGISLELIKRIGTTNKFYVEFGTQDGSECNTRVLREKFAWGGLLMDEGYENNKINLKKEHIVAENIEKLFKKYNVPKEFDLLSIDIDSNDYYVWDAIKNYFPRMVIIEYNSKIPLNKSKSIKYNPNQVWDRTNYMGASLLALKRLGDKNGYTLVSCDNLGVNAFFVRNDLINFKIRDYKNIYRKPKYGNLFTRGHKKVKRKMIPI